MERVDFKLAENEKNAEKIDAIFLGSTTVI